MRNSRQALLCALFSVCLVQPLLLAQREALGRAFDAVTDGGAFQYDTRQRQRVVSGLHADYWVDFSDRSRYDDWEIGFRLTKGLPESYLQFRERILRHYILGYLRTSVKPSRGRATPSSKPSRRSRITPVSPQ